MPEEELTRLALISPPPRNGQYSGSRLKSLIQNLQNQLDQHELVKEFMVGSIHINIQMLESMEIA